VDIFLLTFILAWVVFWIYWFISAWMTRSPLKRKQSHRSWILVALLFSFLVVYSSTSSSGYLFPRPIPDILVIGLSGMIIILMGLGFAVWARVHLGKYWSSMPAIRVDHKLIRTGPYRFVWYPIYTGILVGITDTSIIMGEHSVS
jgi:protein-S-isoprenylcysteine O-methyltransferase Ste14